LTRQNVWPLPLCLALLCPRGSPATHGSRQMHLSTRLSTESSIKHQPSLSLIRQGSFFDDRGNSRIGDEISSFHTDNIHLSEYGATALLTAVLHPIFASFEPATRNTLGKQAAP